MEECYIGKDDIIPIIKDAGLVDIDDKDIKLHISEYNALYEAQLLNPNIEIISHAELLTLARYYKDNKYLELVKQRGLDSEPLVVGGPASVEVIDKQGHLIITDALNKAFKQFMNNFRTRNSVIMHTDAQVGWILPLYINRDGRVYKSGVDDRGMYIITEVKANGRVVEKVRKEIEDGNIRSYSIAGLATDKEEVERVNGDKYIKVKDLELTEISLVASPANQKAHFKLIKELSPVSSVVTNLKNSIITLSDCLVSLTDDGIFIRASDELKEMIRLGLIRESETPPVFTDSQMDGAIPLFKLQLVPHEELGILKSQYSREKCMNWSSPPTKEFLWAEGMARAWFCNEHAEKFRDEHKGQPKEDGEGNYASDINAEHEVKDGVVPQKWGGKIEKFESNFVENSKLKGNPRKKWEGGS